MADLDRERRETTYQSVVYSVLGNFSSRLVTMVGYVVLARFLSPQEFGLITIFMVVAAIVRVIVELGFGPAIVQASDLSENRIRTAFAIHTALGSMATLVLYLGSDALASFFRSPDLGPVVRVLSVSLLFSAMLVVPNSLLIRRKAFKRLAKAEITSCIVGMGVGVGMAVAGWGVWSLVGLVFVTSFANLLMTAMLAGWKPAFKFNAAELRQLLSFGLPLCGTRLYGRASTQVDKILVGKLLSTSVLGAYRFAFQIAELPTQAVAAIFHRVFQSVYSARAKDQEFIRATHLRATRAIAFFTFPALLGLCVLSERFVLVVLGVDWILMAPILSFLAVASLPRTVGLMNDLLYFSQGRTGLQFKVGLFLRTNVLICILVGLQFGLYGLLWGILLARAINFYPAYHFSGKLVGISFTDVLGNLGGVLFAALMMTLMLFGLQVFWKPEPDSWTALLSLILAGASIYFLMAWFFMRERSIEILQMLRPGEGTRISENSVG